MKKSLAKITKDEANQRRLKIAYVHPAEIWHSFERLQNGFVTITTFGVDVEKVSVRNVFFSHERGAFGFVLHHESFDVVPVGCEIPSVEKIYKIVQRVEVKEANEPTK